MQSIWNPERMMHSGFLFTLLPGMRELLRDPVARQDLMRRHLAFFNTHPVLASYICGVVLRLEEQRLLDGTATTADVDKCKTRLSHLLGSLGDRLFWKHLRPCAVLLAVVLALADVPLVVALGVPVLGYNVIQGYYRWHGLRAGYRLGRDILQDLRLDRFETLLRRLAQLGAVLIGAFLTVAALHFAGQGGAAVVVFLAAAVAAAVLQRIAVSPLAALLGPVAAAAAIGYWVLPEFSLQMIAP